MGLAAVRAGGTPGRFRPVSRPVLSLALNMPIRTGEASEVDETPLITAARCGSNASGPDTDRHCGPIDVKTAFPEARAPAP